MRLAATAQTGVSAADVLRTYRVVVERQDEAHALASSHGHMLTLGVRRGDATTGFNAAEALLASLGVCLITNVNALAEKMRLQVDGVRVEVEGGRRWSRGFGR